MTTEFNGFYDGSTSQAINEYISEDLGSLPRISAETQSSGLDPALFDVVYESKSEEIKKENALNNALNKQQKKLKEADPSQILKQDLARSSYFTVSFDTIFKDAQFHVPGNSFNRNTFLPVKSITVNYGSVESLAIPIACYSDVPIMSKRKVGRIGLTLYDLDDDRIEKALTAWRDSMTIKGRTVYLDESYVKMHYKSYNVKGELNTDLMLLVVLQ